MLMAGIVGYEGRVIATDADAEIITLAGKTPKRRSSPTLHFNSWMLACACGTRSSTWLTHVFCSLT